MRILLVEDEKPLSAAIRKMLEQENYVVDPVYTGRDGLEYIVRQHRTMGAVVFAGSFVPIVLCEKWEIHPVFQHFPHVRMRQNLSPKILAPLCGAAINTFYILPYTFQNKK